MKNLFLILLVAGAIYFGFGASQSGISPESAPTPNSPIASAPTLDSAAARFDQRHVGQQVQGTGTVQRMLSDDNDGSRHQRFILSLASGQTLLMAHNIDLAPRIDDLEVGDSVEFNGEYEWNDQGGVVHWTHHDPAGRHVGGWLKHGGSTFE